MTNQFRLQEFNTTRAQTSCRWLLAGTALLLAWLSNPGLAADKIAKLRPYTAQYTTTTRGLDLGLTRKLRTGADGSFTLTNGGKIMVVGFHEVHFSFLLLQTI